MDPGRTSREDLRLALILAKGAVAASERKEASFLDTLAEVLHANGRSREAAVFEEEALSKCAPEDGALRTSLEASLARFRAAASKEPSAPATSPGRTEEPR